MSSLLTALEPNRAVLRVEGPEAQKFLQDLVSNDVAPAAPDRGVYAALLTPQGKLVADMILWRPAPERFLLDVAESFAADLFKKLSLYKLRSAVELAREPDLRVRLTWAENAADGEVVDAPGDENALCGGADPRDARLGRREVIPASCADAGSKSENVSATDFEVWDRLRVSLGVPASGLDLRAGDAYPLEYGFERLSGVDFRKGCFVGQEIVARMKHKAELKKGLFRLTFDGPAPEPGLDVLADGKPAGSVGSSRDGVALALLRFDRAELPLSVGDAAVTALERVES